MIRNKSNPVAKNLNKFNKPATHRDRKKDAKKGERKHKGRDYAKEYANYHSRPDQVKRRTARNAARRAMSNRKELTDEKDVHHKDNNPMNNDKSNLAIVTQHYNRREPRLRNEAVMVTRMHDLKGIAQTIAKNAIDNGSNKQVMNYLKAFGKKIKLERDPNSRSGFKVRIEQKDSVEEGKWFVRQSAKPNKTGTYQGKKFDDGKKAIAQARKDWKLTPDEHMSAKMMKEDVNVKSIEKFKAAERDFNKNKDINFQSIADALSKIVTAVRMLDKSTSGRTDVKYEKVISKESTRINNIVNKLNYGKDGVTPEGKEIVKLLNKHGLNRPFRTIIFEGVEMNENRIFFVKVGDGRDSMTVKTKASNSREALKNIRSKHPKDKVSLDQNQKQGQPAGALESVDLDEDIRTPPPKQAPKKVGEIAYTVNNINRNYPKLKWVAKKNTATSKAYKPLVWSAVVESDEVDEATILRTKTTRQQSAASKEKDRKNAVKTLGDIRKGKYKGVKMANEDDDPCWDSHKQVGMKKKGGKMVPNCVPKNEETVLEQTMLNEFSDAQLAQLKKAYSDLERINVTSPTYKKLKAMIANMDVKALEKVARAKVRFVSQIAAREYEKKSGNRLKAKDYMESVEETKTFWDLRKI